MCCGVCQYVAACCSCYYVAVIIAFEYVLCAAVCWSVLQCVDHIREHAVCCIIGTYENAITNSRSPKYLNVGVMQYERAE